LLRGKYREEEGRREAEEQRSREDEEAECAERQDERRAAEHAESDVGSRCPTTRTLLTKKLMGEFLISTKKRAIAVVVQFCCRKLINIDELI